MMLHVSQAHLLKRQPDTPLGRRDALLVCLFLEQGFRCGEVHTLRVKRIDLEAGTVAVPGEKGNSTHHLTADTLITAMASLPDVQGQEYLFPGCVEKQRYFALFSLPPSAFFDALSSSLRRECTSL